YWCYAQVPNLKFDEEKKLYGYSFDNKNIAYVIPAIYDKASHFHEKIARVAIAQRYYLINAKGKKLHKNSYDYLGWSDDRNFQETPFVQHPFQVREKRIAFKKNNCWGLLNQRGKEILSCRYATIEKYRYGLARVSTYDSLLKKRKYGAIDFFGNEIIPTDYEWLEWNDSTAIRFSKDCSCSETAKKEGLMNFKGEILIPAKYAAIKYLSTKRYGVQDSLGLWGITTEKGQLITPTIYENVESFIKGKSVVTLEGRKGLLDIEGKTVVPFAYREISFNDGQWHLLSFPKYEIIDEEGKVHLTFYADTLYPLLPTWYAFKLNEKVGLIRMTDENKIQIFQDTFIDEIVAVDTSGYVARKGIYFGKISWERIIKIPFYFTSLKKESCCLYRATLQSGEEILLNDNGEFITLPQDKLGKVFSSGLLKIKRQNLFGFIDSVGTLKISPQFINADDFSNNYAVVQHTNGHFGVIDRSGNWIISPVVDSLKRIGDSLFLFKDNGWWGTLNQEGIEQYKDNETDCETVDGHLVFVDKQKRKGLLNKQGKLLLSAQAQEIIPENSTYVRASIDGKWYWIDTQADSVPSSFKNTPTGLPINGTVPQSHEQLWGLTNVWGQWIISPRYDSIKSLSEGMIPFKIGDKWGYLDQLERIVIQPRYTFAGNFQQKRAVVGINQKFALINENGRWILPPNYEEIQRTAYGNWLVCQKGLWGIYTNDGLQGIYPKYTAIEDIGNGFVISQKNGLYGLDKISGLTIVFPKYHKIASTMKKNFFILKTNPERTLIK
ncbi:MAG: WG repeat-containing protein, partial [Flammeovirgaceae bacterium]|nr:WG repeat-containing protein [Flammeovirgaceae bacterium]